MYQYHDIVCTLLPAYVDGYFVRMLYPNREKVNNGATSIPMISEIVPSPEISMSNIGDIFNQSFPVLVKNAMKPDQDRIVGIMAKRNKGRDMRMLNYENYVTPHLSPSCSFMSVAETVSFDTYAKNHLFSNASDSHSPLYAGFEAITDAETIEEFTGLDINQLGDYKQNNLFASNFEKEIMTATLHCAPIDSLTLQLVGTKTWFFVSPEELSTLRSVPMPTSFNLPMTDDELLSKLKNVYVVKQEAGDAMYFGPHWCHAVSTSPGPNLMINMRYFSPKKILEGPFTLALKMMIRKYTRAIGKLPQDNKYLFPIIYDDLTNYFKDCGSSADFNSLYAKVTKYFA